MWKELQKHARPQTQNRQGEEKRERFAIFKSLLAAGVPVRGGRRNLLCLALVSHPPRVHAAFSFLFSFTIKSKGKEEKEEHQA